MSDEPWIKLHLGPYEALCIARRSFDRPYADWDSQQLDALATFFQNTPDLMRWLDSEATTIVGATICGLGPLVRLFGRIFFRGMLENVGYRAEVTQMVDGRADDGRMKPRQNDGVVTITMA